MTVRESVTYINQNHCELVPMPEWNKANALMIINKSKPYARLALLNTK